MKNETDALEQRSQRDYISITKADKGGALVVINVDDYIRDANRQLSKINFYKKIPNDPTQCNRNKVDNTINELKLQRLLDDKTAKNLQTLRKNAKFLYATKNPQRKQCRQAIGSVNCHTTKISQYVDHHLQPHIQELESYVKDSTDFTKKVSTIDKVPQESFLVTMDICSPCINISNNERIKAIETTLINEKSSNESNYQFPKLILALNNFIFNCTNFLQLKGCAMEPKCAATHTNIFMSIY